VADLADPGFAHGAEHPAGMYRRQSGEIGDLPLAHRECELAVDEVAATSQLIVAMARSKLCNSLGPRFVV